MRYLGCSLPLELVLQGACKVTAMLYLPQVPLWGCMASAVTMAAGWYGLPLGRAKFSEMTLSHLPSSPGWFWCPLAEHGPCKTLCNLSLTQSQSKPRKQPLQLLQVPWRHHPWRNLISNFSWSGVFSSPIPAERAGLAITVNKKDYGFVGHWPSLLVLVSCSKRREAACGLQRDGAQEELLVSCFDLMLNPCVA